MDEWPCPHCTEPLLGAVNRCWKCGGPVRQPVAAAIPTDGRYAADAKNGTLTASEIITAAVVSAGDQGNSVVTAESPNHVAVALLTRQEVSLALSTEPPRRGSPFAAEVPLSQRVPHETVYGTGPYVLGAGGVKKGFDARNHAPLAAQYPQHTAAIGGVVASLILGIVSLGVLFFSIFGALIAMPGAIVGIWGLQSNRRNLAILGILLCCLAMAIGGYQTGFAVYEHLFPTSTTTMPGGGF